MIHFFSCMKKYVNNNTVFYWMQSSSPFHLFTFNTFNSKAWECIVCVLLVVVQLLWKSDQIHAEILFPAITVYILTLRLFIFLSTANALLIIILMDSAGFWVQILNSDWIIDQHGLIPQTRWSDCPSHLCLDFISTQIRFHELWR